MTRRSHGLGLAAGAALLGLTFASAETSGAFAQETDPGQIEAANTAGGSNSASTPVFISQEVVQPTVAANDAVGADDVEPQKTG